MAPKKDNTAVAPAQQQKPATNGNTAPRPSGTVASQVRDILSSPSMMAQLKMALPRHLNPERMIRVAVTAIQKTPKLMECSQQSLIACIVEASQLGLEPDGVVGHAYLVPYKNKNTGRMEAQLMAGYKGLIDLARRSGQIGAVNAEIVYENDEFKVVKGLNPDLIHVPNWQDPGEMIAAYATAKLKDGDVQFCVMARHEIDKHRARSKAKDYGPWVTDYEWMAKKTAIRQLCKLLPCSIEMQSVLSKDELRDTGVMQGDDFIDTTATGNTARTPKTLEDVAARARNQQVIEAPAEPVPDEDGVISDDGEGLTEEDTAPWDGPKFGEDEPATEPTLC